MQMQSEKVYTRVRLESELIGEREFRWERARHFALEGDAKNFLIEYLLLERSRLVVRDRQLKRMLIQKVVELIFWLVVFALCVVRLVQLISGETPETHLFNWASLPFTLSPAAMAARKVREVRGSYLRDAEDCFRSRREKDAEINRLCHEEFISMLPHFTWSGKIERDFLRGSLVIQRENYYEREERRGRDMSKLREQKEVA